MPGIWCIEEAAAWVDGEGFLPVWLVVDGEGVEVNSFRNEEDAADWLDFKCAAAEDEARCER